MKYFGGAAKFTNFRNTKGVQYYYINQGTWYGTSQDGNRYISKLSLSSQDISEPDVDGYVSVDFDGLDDYLKTLPNNDTSNPYKIKVCNFPLNFSSGNLGTVLKDNDSKYVDLKFDKSINSLTNANSMFFFLYKFSKNRYI